MELRGCCHHHSPLEIPSSYRTRAPQWGSSSHLELRCPGPAARATTATSSSIYPTSSRQQTQFKSASEQLESYIDRFEQERTSATISAATEGQVLGARLPKNTETDAWDLLCGSGTRGQNFARSPVSVKTRCILQDVDRKMGYTEPCYSSPAKLDLQSLWPSMHEHLERRWRQQLRDRYEERQRAEKLAKAEAVAASAGSSSRADMYKFNHTYAGVSSRQVRQSAPPSPSKLEASSLSRAVRALLDSDNEGDAGGSDSQSGAGSSMLEAAAAAAARSNEERLWGSDSGLGLSCSGAPTNIDREKKTAVAEDTAVVSSGINDEAGDNDTVGDAEGDSFEERMRSYRCVLEAHELSSRLRQHLEAACATVGTGGRRVLSVEDKGRIRDRLAHLQGPLRGGLVPPDGREQRLQDKTNPQQQDQEAERITTERLARLMCSARSLLESRNGDFEATQRLSGSFWKQEDKQEPKFPVSAAVSEAGQDSGQG